MTKITEYVNKDGTITVDYMKKHVPSRDTNNIYCHPYYEIIIIVSGKVTYTANEGVTRIGERSVVFIEPYTVHNPFVHDVQIYERYRIRFYPDFASGLLSDKYSEELISLLSGSYMKELEDSDFDAVRQANKSLSGEFRIGLDLYSDEGCSFVLPRNLISVAQRLSMPIDIDAIFLTESEESSTPYESAVGLFGINAGEVVVLGRSIGIEAVESVLQHVSTFWSHKERQYNQCTLSIAGERPVIVLPLFFLEICNGMCKEFKIEVKARKDLILNDSIVQ
jgi:hypothetical protein